TIADGSDSALDSNVLLKAGSFTSSVEVTQGGPGDFNGDGYADVSDLLILIADYGCEVSCVGDINADGISNVLDILEFLQLFE
ncbi:MAG: Dockerin type domain, partial [Bacteroidota bacterium]